MSEKGDPIIKISGLNKQYQMGETLITAVNDVSFEIARGSVCVLLGASGAGKSTVLNILGGMDLPSSGSVFVEETDIARFNARRLTRYRRERVGFVFQFYNLMPNLTVLENVELARQISPNPMKAKDALDMVGLSARLNNFPSQISGGEQQRVAIARALAKNPSLLLCDEPTGALDYQTGKAVLQTLIDVCRKANNTVIIVTHNSALAPIGDLLLRMRSGKLVEMKRNKAPVAVGDIEW